MVRVLPTGPAVNRLEVVARERPSDFSVRAGSGPTPFLYRYRLSAENEATLLHLRAEVELPAIPALLAPVARRGVKKGVEDNFAALKALLEVRP